MQIKNPNMYTSSKFAEGRLKLSTSCTECHKRKQKCNQQQPCQHCSRRYPPPICIFRRRPESAAQTQTLELDTVPLRSNGFGSEIFVRNGALKTPNTLAIADDMSTGNPFREGLNTICENAGDDFRNFSQESFGPIISRMADALGPHNLENLQTALRTANVTHSQSVPLGLPKNVSVEPLQFLGITPTTEKAALLSAFVKNLTKYTVSLDGQPTPNYYNSHFVPWSLKSPLLTMLSIYTTAAIQSESRKVPPNSNPVVLSYKLAAIRLLNEKLQSEKGLNEQVGNEAICAVAILVSMEWYWSEFDIIEQHLKGLVEMVRLRGGLGELGLHEFLKRMILIVDYNIASTYDREPLLPHNVAILPRHPAHVMTPLLSSSGVTFSANHEELGISQATADVLDNVRFLILSTIKNADRATSPQEQLKLQRMADWTQEWIAALPADNEEDPIYASSRIAAQIYCSAIAGHITLSKSCSVQHLAQLWGSLWKVSVSRWKQIPGIFLWVLLSGLQGAEHTPYGRFLKSMVKGVMTYLAVDHWDVVDVASLGFVKLQRWLRNSEEFWVNAREI